MTKDIGDFVKNVRLVKFILRVMDAPEKTIRLERETTNPRGYGYPLAEEYLGTGAPAELEALAKEALLEQVFVDKEYGCPKCRSVNLSLKSHCPNCDNTRLRHVVIVEHLACGFQGPREKFADDTCPKCSSPLGRLGADFVEQGKQYTCDHCGHIFPEPIQKLSCIRCRVSFGVGEAPEIDLYEYRLMPRLEEEINKTLDQQKYIQDKIKAMGFKIVAPAIIEGKSGVEQQFFMLASAGIGFLKMCIVVEILGDVTPNDVFSLHGRAADVGAYGVLFAAVPGLSEDARKVADNYGLAYIEADDLSTAAERLVKRFGELVQAPEEAVFETLSEMPLGRRSTAG